MRQRPTPVPDSARHSEPSPLGWFGRGLFARIARQPKSVQIAEGLALIVLIGLTDYWTHWGLDLSPLYMIPVLWISYHTDKNTGLLLALSSVVMCCAITTTMAPPSIPLTFHYFNSLIKFILFLVIVYLFSYLRGTLELVQRLANTDALTGLLNPRHFRQRAEAERQRAERYRRCLTVVYLDLDYFKDFNDRWGHRTGDTLLRTVAEVLRQGTRSHDLVARLGGDEFGLLLAETDYDSAHGCLDRLRDQLLEAMTPHGWQMTFSIGAVTYLEMPPDVDGMLEQADQFMYQVKRNGKDRLEHQLLEPAELALTGGSLLIRS